MLQTTLVILSVLVIVYVAYVLMVRTGRVLQFGAWHGCVPGDYIYSFREQLTAIAGKIWLPKQNAYVRFNPDETCAEFYVVDSEGNNVFARVHVHGECGSPDEVIVYSDLPMDIRALFVPLSRLGVAVVFKAFDEWKSKKQK